MGHVLFLRLADIAQDGADRIEQQRYVLFCKACRFFRRRIEMPADVVGADPLSKQLVSAFGNVQVVHVGQLFPEPGVFLFGNIDEDFLWLDLRDLGQQHLAAVRSAQLQRGELAGGDVAPGKAESIASLVQRSQKVVVFFIQDGVGQHRAGRDHPDDVPLHKAFGERGVGQLFGYRDLITLLHQSGDIVFAGMVRHPAHRGSLFLAALLAGEDQIQFPGGCLGVVEKHLVEIAETVKQDAVGILPLRRQILPHHG